MSTQDSTSDPSAISACKDEMSQVIYRLGARKHVLTSLRMMIDAHTLVSICDRDGYIVYVNDKFCEVSKYSRNELIGQKHDMLRAGYHPPEFFENIWNVIQSGNVWSGDIKNRAKDGSLYWVQCTISPIYDDDNKIVGYGSVRTDVTDHRTAMAALEDSERRAQAILKSATDTLDSGLHVYDADARLVITNKTALEMYPEANDVLRPGVHGTEILARIRPDLDPDEIERQVKEHMTVERQALRQLSDGRHVRITRSPTPEGGMISVHTDITDLMEQKERSERQAATLDLMMEIAVAANESEDADAAYSACLDLICKYADWQVGHTYLLKEGETEVCYPGGSWYVSDAQQFKPFRDASDGIEYEAGVGLPGMVLQSGQPEWVRDCGACEDFPRAKVHASCGLVGGAAFPVRVRNEIVAVLEFFATRPLEYSPELSEILSHVCTQVGRVAERERAEKQFVSRVNDELRKRDRELVEQNERFEGALKNMSQGICVFDKDKRLIVANRQYGDIYGLDPELLTPGTPLKAILEARVKKGVFADGTPEDYYKERFAWVESRKRSNTVQHLTDGRVIAITHQPMDGGGWLTTHEDITERIESEKELKESRELLTKAFRTSPAAMAISSTEDGSHLEVNDTWCNKLGYTREDAMEHSAVELGVWANPEDRERFIATLKETGSVHGFEAKFRRKDGEYLDVIAAGELVEVGGNSRLLIVWHDITERKKAERELRVSEGRFKDIVEVSSDWIWECDEDLRFTYLSDRFTEITGVSKSDVIGKTRREFAKHSDADWETHLADLEARRPFRNFYYSVAGPKGTEHWSISGRPVFDPNGRFKGYRGTGYDRTEQVTAQAELIRHRDHLQELVNEATGQLKQQADELKHALAKEKELNEMQRQFLSMASHEFRTPLAIIDSSAQRLMRNAAGDQDDRIRKRVEKIRAAVSRMTQLMESTLAAARLESGNASLKLESVDIASVIRHVCEQYEEISSTHKISCRFGALPGSIIGDRAALEQVFTNLLSNAVKYSPENKDVEIAATVDGHNVVVTVKDHGLGIDPEDLPKMFQKFFRARTATGIAGTGIGLNLVKTLIELHGGSISVRSEPGAGSEFTVRLPVGGPNTTQADQEEAA